MFYNVLSLLYKSLYVALIAVAVAERYPFFLFLFYGIPACPNILADIDRDCVLFQKRGVRCGQISVLFKELTALG